MKRKALYSRAARPRARLPEEGGAEGFADEDIFAQDEPLGAEMARSARRAAARHERKLLVIAAILIGAALLGVYHFIYPDPAAFTRHLQATPANQAGAHQRCGRDRILAAM